VCGLRLFRIQGRQASDKRRTRTLGAISWESRHLAQGGKEKQVSDIKLGDKVQIIGTWIIGKVTEIDDHPFEYPQVKIEYEAAGGHVETWQSSRFAQVVERPSNHTSVQRAVTSED